MRTKTLLAAALVALPLTAGCVRVHVDPVEATLNVNIRNVDDDLDSYFAYESREKYPLFNDLKDQGKIGETYLGYVEAVKPQYMNDPVVKTIVDGANKDRQMIYGTLAKKNNTTVEKVALQNAARNFRLAEPGQWLKTAKGWEQKGR